jgi:hypothetical protein
MGIPERYSPEGSWRKGMRRREMLGEMRSIISSNYPLPKDKNKKQCGCKYDEKSSRRIQRNSASNCRKDS